MSHRNISMFLWCENMSLLLRHQFPPPHFANKKLLIVKLFCRPKTDICVKKVPQTIFSMYGNVAKLGDRTSHKLWLYGNSMNKKTIWQVFIEIHEDRLTPDSSVRQPTSDGGCQIRVLWTQSYPRLCPVHVGHPNLLVTELVSNH